jgi:putative SOS response-associated peptidase YedK
MCERYGLAPRYNIAHGQTATVIVDGEEQAQRWGLLAPWRGHGGKRGPMTYDTAEAAIAATPQLRKAVRVRVPADGFFAWRKVTGKRIPYWIHAGRVHFVGLSSTGDDHVPSFAIVTVPATGDVARATPVMPMIEERDVRWRVAAVSTWVNDVTHDDEHCITPLGNPAQGELF